ncbi:protein kinase domain-containing protein [Stigmatella erecta]|uniref:Serine/threonine protein kinase n=1 Tax=Stigmatella erecta TaxID=83460 RepID=A0A1I0LFI6_9BACT|nr:protein kinase [Stigmatella erecta]SEU38914.1 Serine/threonine protein kinase [Stigmatella erecta]
MHINTLCTSFGGGAVGIYRLVRQLASGGMAEVFLAKVFGAEGFEKPVAVKRVLPSLAKDREFVELFLREAKLTVSLQHANVLQVFDLGEVRGQYYMVMEFVDGENLRTLQRAAAAAQVPMGLREGVFIVQQVAEGLAYAHDKLDAAGRPLNIIHRDINPSNVMISVAGEVKLADFGIAKAANVQGGTQAGVVKGKVGYLAPEQVRGGGVDQRSDLFLLGLLLYELLSGQQLFSGTDYFRVLRSISAFDVKAMEPLPGVPAPLWSIVTRALAQEPSARFQRARDMADALQDFLFEHRLRVGPQDVARLFARCLPGRRSPLEAGPHTEFRGEEIRLGGEGAAEPVRTGGWRAVPRLEPHRPTTPPMGSIPGTPGVRTVALRPQPRPDAARPQGTPPPAEPGHRVALPLATPVLQLAPPRARPPVRRPLGELLVSSGKLSEPQLHAMLERQRRDGGKLGEWLVAEGFVTDEEVVAAISEQQGIAFIAEHQLRHLPVPTPLLSLLPLEHAARFEAVPLALHGKELVCAMREPENLDRLSELQFLTGYAVRGVLASDGAIRRAINRFYLGEELSMRMDWGSLVKASVMGAPPVSPPSGMDPSQEKTDEALPREAARPEPSRKDGRGEAGEPGGREARLLARALESALAALGGAGVQGAVLARLTRQVALRLGASPGEAGQGAAVAYAIACAARLEGKAFLARPACESVRAVLGREAGEVAALIQTCAEAAPAGHRMAQALAAAMALLEALGPTALSPEAAARALGRLREEGRLPGGVLEALAVETAELVLGEARVSTVVLAEPDAQRSATLQARFLADGVRVLLADSAARVRQCLREGAQALVVASHLPDGEGAALTRLLREAEDTAALPIFVLAPPEDPALVEAGLDAGADDVLAYPVNPDVLAAKVRRSLQPRRALVPGVG